MNAKLVVPALILLVAAGLSLGVARTAPPPGTPEVAPLAPEFTGVSQWLNTKPLKLADQKGKVVLVHFWTNGCFNCVNNYPHYRELQSRYQDAKDFLIVGVHTPEFDAEKNVDRIKERMKKNGLTFAVAVDNDTATWKAWGNRYWPCAYLVDKSGHVRQKFEGEFGEAGAKRVVTAIDALRAEAGK